MLRKFPQATISSSWSGTRFYGKLSLKAKYFFFLFFMNGLLLAYNRFLVDVWWKLNLLVLLILLGHSLQNFIHWSVCGKS